VTKSPNHSSSRRILTKYIQLGKRGSIIPKNQDISKSDRIPYYLIILYNIQYYSNTCQLLFK